jgi:NAD(P)-dependent dehydrogenase (short-subunit alcohol dehydrogenase family)
MKTVVITGSARGLGFELAKRFRENNYNVVLSDINKENLLNAEKELLGSINSEAKVISEYADVTSEKDLENLMSKAVETFGVIDIWINNAGVNQPDLPIWEVDTKVIDRLIDIDLKSAIVGSKVAMKQMIKQGYGQIYGVEGYGSNDAMMLGLSIYGTSKRAITYFFKALAKEIDTKGLNIQVGLLSPGIMITDFITHSMGDTAFELPEKTKKVYNILGDYPDVISKFLVDKIVKNKKNSVRFNWLTTGKASLRFMTAGFNKRDFFKKED